MGYSYSLQGHWRGIWWGGRQHGLQLWCRTDAEGREVEATPFLFNLDVKVGLFVGRWTWTCVMCCMMCLLCGACLLVGPTHVRIDQQPP